MSTGKSKSRRENDLWKECLVCSVVISCPDPSEKQKHFHKCPVILSEIEERLGLYASVAESPSTLSHAFEKQMCKNINPKRLFKEDEAFPDNTTATCSPLGSDSLSPASESSKPQGFCLHNKLFGICTQLASKGIDMKNIPSVLHRDIVLLHPSAMRVCGIGIGDPVLLTSAKVPQRLGYAWPCPSLQPTSLSLMDKVFTPGEIVRVQLYPFTLCPAARVVVQILSTEDKRFKEKLKQVIKTQLCNHPIKEGSVFSVNFFGRQINTRIHFVSGCMERTSRDDISDTTQDLVQALEEKCSLEDDSPLTEEMCNTPSSVSGFRNVVFTPRKEVIMNLLKEKQPQFFEVTNATKITLLDERNSKYAEAKKVSYKDIGGLEQVIVNIKEIMDLVFRKPNILVDQGVPVPKGILLFGPPGAGKTLLVEAIREEEDVHFVSIRGPDIYSKYVGETEDKLKLLFEEAVEQAPSIIFLDDVHILCPRQEQSSDQQRRFLNALLQLIDDLQSESERLLLVAATNRLDAVDLSLRRPGRLDILVDVPVPTPTARIQILNKLLARVNHNLSADDVERIAESAHSFTGGDLSVMVREAVRSCLNSGKPDCILTLAELSKLAESIKPTAMKEVTLEVPKVYWSDIGGQEKLKLELCQSVEWPLKHPEAFKRLGIKAPHGLLMYGPPGCSKTLIAKALATESGLNFLAIKGPELFNKWVGESERQVREVFRKARAAAPSVVFFDEIDALAAERSTGASQGGSSVGNRVLAQLLNEMDGVETLEGVTVVAATNRPDMIDQALLRPGRLDSVTYVPLPDEQTRREILQIQMRNMPVAEDTDLEHLVKKTEGYSGAEVVSVCQKAGMMALSESLNAESIHGDHFQKALQAVQPRTDPELIRLYKNFHSRASFCHL